jgi:hypothetical protein
LRAQHRRAIDLNSAPAGVDVLDESFPAGQLLASPPAVIAAKAGTQYAAGIVVSSEHASRKIAPIEALCLLGPAFAGMTTVSAAIASYSRFLPGLFEWGADR